MLYLVKCPQFPPCSRQFSCRSRLGFLDETVEENNGIPMERVEYANFLLTTHA